MKRIIIVLLLIGLSSCTKTISIAENNEIVDSCTVFGIKYTAFTTLSVVPQTLKCTVQTESTLTVNDDPITCWMIASKCKQDRADALLEEIKMKMEKDTPKGVSECPSNCVTSKPKSCDCLYRWRSK